MKNIILLCLTSCLFIGCATKPSGKYLGKVRTTYYCAAEDRKWGNKVAMSSKLRASEGVTVAVDPKVIPYGSTIKIPELEQSIGSEVFIAQDTGSSVKSRKASGGKTIIIDVYVDSRYKMNVLAANNDPYLDAYLVE